MFGFINIQHMTINKCHIRLLNSFAGSMFKTVDLLHSTVSGGVKLIFTVSVRSKLHVLKLCPAV